VSCLAVSCHFLLDRAGLIRVETNRAEVSLARKRERKRKRERLRRGLLLIRYIYDRTDIGTTSAWTHGMAGRIGEFDELKKKRRKILNKKTTPPLAAA
jgi:hypothetical protein